LAVVTRSLGNGPLPTSDWCYLCFRQGYRLQCLTISVFTEITASFHCGLLFSEEFRAWVVLPELGQVHSLPAKATFCLCLLRRRNSCHLEGTGNRK
jgi:hypothetical protein